MCRVVVSGVLHPKNINFFPSFVNNLNLQTFKNFDLLIINEGIDKSLLNINFKKGELIIENSKFANPKKNRDQMFDSLRELRYDVNILCDFDDLMSADRVSEAVVSIIKNKSDICYNDIIPFVNQKKISINDRCWSERNSFSDQKPNIKHNVFGLGNTAISSRIASLKIQVSNNTVYDWEYFLKLYLPSKHIVSKSNGYTFYRQTNNTLGIGRLSINRFNEIIKIKIFTLDQIKDKYPFVKEEILQLKSINFEEIKNKINNKFYWFEL